MIILGLNAFHGDSSAALVRDGVLVAAAEEERFRRTKHWAGFPSEAIKFCLNLARIKLDDVNHIAVNQNSRASILRKIAYIVTNGPSPKLLLERHRNRRRRHALPECFSRAFPETRLQARFHYVEHHLAHLASAFLVSPFKSAIVVSVDGFGDFSSAAWGTADGNEISVQGRVHFPHSLGIFYQALTQYLGFPNYGDEYKVMGLAPYGHAAFMSAMHQIVRLSQDGTFELNLDYFRHHRENVSYEWDGGMPTVQSLFSPALEELLGPRRKPNEDLHSHHRDIARSVQQMYEEAFFHLLATVQGKTGMADLALSGGCAMNSVANGKVQRLTSFKRVYVQSAPGDAGGAIGAAIETWHQLGGARRFIMDHAYWGPEFGQERINGLLEEHKTEIAAAGCAVEQFPDAAQLCQNTAQAIADGCVVGWFQGRMEWGPRALGNRSILCDPRRADIKDVLNAKIKRRESFRPFAPSVLRDHVAEWFEEDCDVPFMMQVHQIRPEKRKLIPAVTHVDGSGRLQTVTVKANPLYFQLIESFRKITSVPMILNTSFNENEPIVCEPKQALECFLRTKMDTLVLGNMMLRRRGANIK